MPQNFRFTTRRLFLVSAGFALSAATFPAEHESEGLDWPSFLLSLVSFLAVLGLCQQIRDLWQLRREHSLCRDERFAVWLAVSWRAALLGALAACYTLELLISRGFVEAELQGLEDAIIDFSPLFPDVAWSLLVFLSLAAIPGALPSREGRFVLPKTRRIAALILALALVVVVLFAKTILHWLVHLAIAGIEVHQPLHVQRRATFPDHAREDFAFFWTACFGLACAAVNLIALGGFARAVRTGSRWRRPALFVLLAGLGLSTGYATWYTFGELPRVSPDMAAADVALNAAGAVFLTCAVLAAAFLIALRLTTGGEVDVHNRLRWRRTNRYLHEYRTAPLLAVALAVYELAFLEHPLGGFLFQDLFSAIRGLVEFGSPHGLIQTAGWALHWLPTYIWLAIGWVAIRLLFRPKQAEPAADATALQPVSPTLFLTFSLLATWLIVSGLFTLAAFAFAWWFGPWWG